ncbi:MAG: response regulator [Thaumarchaeota archaeon]|nr:response regulator [Nitrososphaerota archaeon]
MKLSRLRILCVDDDSNDRMILSHSLEQNLGLDFDIITASTGEEALLRYEENEMDLVILDHKLPGMTGLDLLDEFRKRNTSVAIIFLTGTGSERVAAKAMKQGAHEYLIKEDVIVNPHLLANTIRSLVEESAFIAKEKVSSAGSTAKGRGPIRAPTNGIPEFKEMISTSGSSWLVAFLVASEQYSNLTKEVLRLLVNEMDSMVIYITINNPYSSLKKSLSDSHVRVENIFFIDAISGSAGLSSPNVEDCTFLDGPNSLTNLGIELRDRVSRYDDDNGNSPIILLDSVSTLLLHNSEASVGKFIHFTATRIKMWKAKGVFFSIQEDVNKEVVRTLQQYCDATIVVK